MPRLDYFAPGVYVEEVDRGSRPIEGVQTNIGAFIGFSEAIRNGAEIGKPMLVTTWSQYQEYFGKENSDGYTDFDAYLPFAVDGWFLNGGARCWVVSIGTELPKPAGETTQPLTGLDGADTQNEWKARISAIQPETRRSRKWCG